jgi:hypothetical protein
MVIRGRTIKKSRGHRSAMESPRMPHPIMTLLTAGVPLTLILDLAYPDGPDSQMIYRLEQPVDAPAPASAAAAPAGLRARTGA